MIRIHSPNFSSRVEAFASFKPSSHGNRALTSPSPEVDTPERGIEVKPLSSAPLPSKPVVSPSGPDRLPGEPMSKEAMVQVLKARNLSVHGAHVRHLGIPAILLLASAYATDRITRKTFFDTLDLFLQHTGRSWEHAKGLKAHHLTTIGISAQDAVKLPLIDTDCDFYTVAGFFNGLIDTADLDLLYSADKKGAFLQRYFPGMAAVPAPTLFSPAILWDENDLLVRNWTFRSTEFDAQIAPACARLEKGRGYYTGIHHYLLRLTAASRSGKPVSELGPLDSAAEMNKLFHDIFQIVEPDYQPSITWRQDLEHFHFVEPVQRDDRRGHPDKRGAKVPHADNQRGGSRLPCNLV